MPPLPAFIIEELHSPQHLLLFACNQRVLLLMVRKSVLEQGWRGSASSSTHQATLGT